MTLVEHSSCLIAQAAAEKERIGAKVMTAVHIAYACTDSAFAIKLSLSTATDIASTMTHRVALIRIHSGP